MLWSELRPICRIIQLCSWVSPEACCRTSNDPVVRGQLLTFPCQSSTGLYSGIVEDGAPLGTEQERSKPLGSSSSSSCDACPQLKDLSNRCIKRRQFGLHYCTAVSLQPSSSSAHCQNSRAQHHPTTKPRNNLPNLTIKITLLALHLALAFGIAAAAPPPPPREKNTASISRTPRRTSSMSSPTWTTTSAPRRRSRRPNSWPRSRT